MYVSMYVGDALVLHVALDALLPHVGSVPACRGIHGLDALVLHVGLDVWALHVGLDGVMPHVGLDAVVPHVGLSLGSVPSLGNHLGYMWPLVVVAQDASLGDSLG